MSQYGCTITKKGRELIAKVLASKTPLTLTRVMMGSGICPDDVFPGDLQDLIEPVAAGTSSTPVYDGDTVHMTVEYRSDMNGGLDHGFWIREFGVFAKDPTVTPHVENEGTPEEYVEDGEILLYYATLGDYPQWVSAFSDTGLDVRRYPVSITVGEGATVIIDYSPEAFMTSEDVEEFCMISMLPVFMDEARKLIAEHNADPDAHPAILNQISTVDSRLSLLELMYNTDVSGNPFTVTFETLTGLVVSGVWNTTQKRIEF